MKKPNYNARFWIWFALTMINAGAWFYGPNNISLFFMGFSIVNMVIYAILDRKE